MNGKGILYYNNSNSEIYHGQFKEGKINLLYIINVKFLYFYIILGLKHGLGIFFSLKGRYEGN
jgi:hypothetical protein